MPCTRCLSSTRSSTAAPTPRSWCSCDQSDCAWTGSTCFEEETALPRTGVLGKGERKENERGCVCGQGRNIKSSFVSIMLPLPAPLQELSLRIPTQTFFRGDILRPLLSHILSEPEIFKSNPIFKNINKKNKLICTLHDINLGSESAKFSSVLVFSESCTMATTCYFWSSFKYR